MSLKATRAVNAINLLQDWLCVRHVYHERLVLVVILARCEVEPMGHACDCFFCREDAGRILTGHMRFGDISQLYLVRLQGTCDHPLAGGLAPHDVHH